MLTDQSWVKSKAPIWNFNSTVPSLVMVKFLNWFYWHELNLHNIKFSHFQYLNRASNLELRVSSLLFGHFSLLARIQFFEHFAKHFATGMKFYYQDESLIPQLVDFHFDLVPNLAPYKNIIVPLKTIAFKIFGTKLWKQRIRKKLPFWAHSLQQAVVRDFWLRRVPWVQRLLRRVAHWHHLVSVFSIFVRYKIFRLQKLVRLDLKLLSVWFGGHLCDLA